MLVSVVTVLYFHWSITYCDPLNSCCHAGYYKVVCIDQC